MTADNTPAGPAKPGFLERLESAASDAGERELRKTAVLAAASVYSGSWTDAMPEGLASDVTALADLLLPYLRTGDR